MNCRLLKTVHFRVMIGLMVAVSCDQDALSSEYERAAVVWLASVIGNDCELDVSKDGTSVSCRILDSLGFDSLFDDKHIGYLNHWFRYDSLTKEYFQSDPFIPLGSSSASNTILSYSITHRKDTLFLNYRGAYWVHGEYGEFEEKSTFLKKDESLILIENRVSL